MNELNEQGVDIQNWVDMSSIMNDYYGSQMIFFSDLGDNGSVASYSMLYVNPIGK